MLEHLLEPPVIPDPGRDFTPLPRATPAQLIDSQVGTSDWLTAMGAPDAQQVLDVEQEKAAQAAFVAVTAGQSLEEQKQALTKVNIPPAVRAVVGMLTAYDWAFVEQAKELRGYAVAKILEDCEHPEARHRLRALELLGKVTEVALFTERTHITKIDLTDEALETKIKQKLDKFRHVIDISDVIEQPHAPD